MNTTPLDTAAAPTDVLTTVFGKRADGEEREFSAVQARQELSPSFDIAFYNPAGDGVTDDTAAFNALIAAVNASTEAAVTINISGNFYLPGGVETEIARNNVTIFQYGARIRINNGPLWTFGDRNALYGEGGVYGGVVSGSNIGNATTRVVKVQGFGGVHIVDVNPDRLGGIVTLGHDSTYRGQGAIIRDIRGSTLDEDGSVAIDCAFGGGLVAHGVSLTSIRSDGTVAPFPTNRTDLSLQKDTVAVRCAESYTWDTVSMTSCVFGHYNVGLQMSPGGTSSLINFKFTNCFWDYCGTNGLEMLPSGGAIHAITFVSCWFFGIDNYAVNVAGSGYVSAIKFVGCEGRQSGKSNWKFANVTLDSVELIGCYGMGANRLSNNTGSDQDDLVIGVGGVAVIGGRFGIDGNPHLNIAGNQGRYGVSIAPNLSNLSVENVVGEGATGGFLSSPNTSNGLAVGVRNNRRRNQANPEYAFLTVPTVPTSGSLQTWRGPFDVTVHIRGGTFTDVKQRGVTISSGSDCSFTLKPGDTWLITYSAAPTIVFNYLP